MYFQVSLLFIALQIHQFCLGTVEGGVPLENFYPFGDSAHEAILPDADNCDYGNPVPLPFPFRFSGVNYSAINPDRNGFITLGSDRQCLHDQLSVCYPKAIQKFVTTAPHIMIFTHKTSTRLDEDGAMGEPVPLCSQDVAEPEYKKMCARPFGSITHHIHLKDATSLQNVAVFERASKEIASAFPDLMDISERIEWVYSITYFNVSNNSPIDTVLRCYLGGRFNTYQLALVTTTLQESFVIFKYNQVQWYHSSRHCSSDEDKDVCCGLEWNYDTALAGILFANMEKHPMSLRDTPICSTNLRGINDLSNMGVPGMFIFRVDEDDITRPITEEPQTTTESTFDFEHPTSTSEPKIDEDIIIVPSITEEPFSGSGSENTDLTTTDRTTTIEPKVDDDFVTSPTIEEPWSGSGFGYTDTTESSTDHWTTTSRPSVTNGTCSIKKDDDECSCFCSCEKEPKSKNKYFLVNDEAMTWPGAKKACKDQSARLAVVKTAQDHETVQSFQNLKMWIGLSRSEECPTGWKWVDGSCLNGTLTFWTQTNPSNSTDFGDIHGEDCVEYHNYYGYGWNDWSCRLSLQAALCERNMDDCKCSCDCNGKPIITLSAF